MRANYHYTYLITNLNPLTVNRYYIGVHSSNIDPESDNYMSSSRFLKEAIKENTLEQFEKIVIEQWSSRKEAEEHEVRLHAEYNVATNELFYNKANALNNGFSTFGNEDAVQKRLSTLANRWDEIAQKISSTKTSLAGLEVSKTAMIKAKKTRATIEGKIRQVAGRVKFINNINSKTGKQKQVQGRLKESATKSNPLWIKNNSIECEHCKNIFLSNHYSRWHGDKCKSKDLE